MLAAAQGHQAAVFILGDENDLDAPMVPVLKMPEGFVAPRHSHGCHRLELVIEGEHIRNDGTVLGAGDIATSGPNENYGPFLVGKGPRRRRRGPAQSLDGWGLRSSTVTA